MGKNLDFPVGNRTRVMQVVASRFTDLICTTFRQNNHLPPESVTFIKF
jgi:hypothetical protein